MQKHILCLRQIDKLDGKNRFPWTIDLMFKGLVHPNMKISLCFTRPQSILGRAGVGLIFSPGVSCLRPGHFVFLFYLFIYFFCTGPFSATFVLSIIHFLSIIFCSHISNNDFFFFFLSKVPLSGESKDNYVIIAN